MARYIDADALIRLIRIDAICYKPYSKLDAIACVKTMPTADVAPRAEVAREIFEELRRYIINHCYLADDDVDAIWKHIDKIEKKYTEDNQ